MIVAPGQGSQTPGFLEPWLADSGLRDHLARISDEVGIDLVAHGTTSDAEAIRDTKVAQPLIVAAGLLTLSALFPEGLASHRALTTNLGQAGTGAQAITGTLAGTGSQATTGALAATGSQATEHDAAGTAGPSAERGRAAKIGGVAGHSVGEVTAAAAAGILTEADAVRFVRERGQAMAAAAALEPTGMSAVIGGDEAALLERLNELGLQAANFNGGGQLVVAGALPALAELAENPVAGTRVIGLQVAGAFHTRYMLPAVAHLDEVAAGLDAHDPTLPIWSNRDGARVTNGRAFVDALVSQVSSPVRWDLIMESLTAAGVTGIIELAPAGALVGLAKRGLKGVPTVAVKTPDDLAAALDLIDAA